MTAEELIKWVDRRVLKALREGSGKTTLEQVLWYVAYQEAAMLQEETQRHLAQAIQHGIGPYKTMEHLQAWLDGQDEDEIHDLKEQILKFWEDDDGDEN